LTVKKISVAQKPQKTIYVVGDKFSAEGGMLAVTYSDNSTAEIPMTSEGVTFSSTSLSSSGTKNITITYGGKTARMTVSVSDFGYTVTFDYNYTDAPAAGEQTVAGGATAIAEEPVREGYSLYAWYTDVDYKEMFNFDSAINEDTTLYAFWKKDGETYVDFTFDYDYYGVRLASYTRPVQLNTAVEKPSDPAREGYRFDGWYTDDTYAQEYVFSSPVTQDTTAVAKWTKTVDGKHDYVFEAEDTDLTGKEGVGSSGAAVEKAMVQYDYDDSLQPSNGRWVGFMYRKGLSLEFNFASDIAVSDATISISVSTELDGSYTFDKSNYSLILNGKELTYTAFTLTTSGDTKTVFATYQLVSNVSLLKGANTLQLKVNNSTSIQGTTYVAVAPMVDCVTINTSAVLIWDENKGLPAKNY
jgi:uncharacterized repeat protein (TIGR02543 family)